MPWPWNKFSSAPLPTNIALFDCIIQQWALKLNLPLVLQIRGWEEEGRQLLKELKVSANYSIHQHCFTESPR